MGEITDALRRARREEAKRPVEATAPDPLIDEPVLSPARAMPITDEFQNRPARRATDFHIPHSKEGSWVARAVLIDQHGPYSAYYRHFALRLGSELKQRDTHVVLVTSAVGQEGKTTTVCNLALAFASMTAARRVAIVEFDLRRPTIASVLGFKLPEVGIENVLFGEASLASACLHSDDGVDIYPVVGPNDNAHEVLARPELGVLIRNLAQTYDIVVLDTPPVLPVPDVSLILPHVEVCITVVRAGATPLSAFRAMLDLIPPEKVAGVFLNNASKRKDFSQYDYHSDSSKGRKTR
ncbi:MAG: CpsD/CapB family tyrosine-protein kinase [Deltaproteobacteria bacterium]|nr:CpsD/CapB family tyrosine-protein kinase [Deltaproteobacteria bacterium]